MSHLLLCPPDYYGIEYEINPWMSRARRPVPERAREQWEGLCAKLRALGCAVELAAPGKNLPDMVFTANAGLVVGRTFIRSNFRFPERRGEEDRFEQWFRERGYQTVRLPPQHYFEGEGDALFCGEVLFCGYHFRSDIQSHRRIGELLGCLVVSVELVQDRFYHLDTCFCPLPDGGAVWHPAAFDAYGQEAIRKHVGDLIEVSAEEANRFGCNAVVVDHSVVLPDHCPKLAAALAERNYEPSSLPMAEFIKAGGACKCLVLFLPQREG